MLYVDPTKVVADFPAVKYVEARETADYDNSGIKIVQVHHRDEFASQLREGHQTNFSFFSVFGSALGSCEDPIKQMERAVGFGHELHGVIQSSVGISDQKSEKKLTGVIKIGQKIKFEGKYFELQKSANNNIHLNPIEKPERIAA